SQHRTPVAVPAPLRVDSGEPELEAEVDGLEEAESDRLVRRAADFGKIDVARNGDRRQVAGARVLFDEISGVERLTEVREKQRCFARCRRELAVEAAARGAVTNQRTEDREMTDVCRLEHAYITGIVNSFSS